MPRSRPSGSAPTCASSPRCWRATTSTGCSTATSATAACTSGSTFARRPRGPAAPVPDRSRSSGRRVRRLAVRRARRRPGPERAAADHVRARRSRRSPRSRPCSTRTGCSTPGIVGAAPARRRPAAAAGPPAAGAGRVPLAADGGDLSAAAHRCVGMGKCRGQRGAGGMCPSYLATRDEKDSTRGRARVLQELRERHAGHRRLAARPRCARRSTCACPARAARADCPAAVDMATYKSEVLYQATAAGCGRRATTRSAGCPAGPSWPRSRPAWPTPLAAPAGLWAGAGRSGACGVDARAPAAALRRASQFRQGSAPGPGQTRRAAGPAVGRHVHRPLSRPRSARPPCAVLEAAGYAVDHDRHGPLCCGLTWISTGQLGRPGASCARLAGPGRPAEQAG